MSVEMSHFELGPWGPATLRLLYEESLRYVGAVAMPGGGQAVHAHMSGGQPLSRLPVYECVVCEMRACQVCITYPRRGCRLIAVFFGDDGPGEGTPGRAGRGGPA